MLAMSAYFKRKGYTKVAHLYSADPFGQYDYNNLHDLAPQFGYTITAAEKFTPDDTNFNAQWPVSAPRSRTLSTAAPPGGQRHWRSGSSSSLASRRR